VFRAAKRLGALAIAIGHLVLADPGLSSQRNAGRGLRHGASTATRLAWPRRLRGLPTRSERPCRCLRSPPLGVFLRFALTASASALSGVSFWSVQIMGLTRRFFDCCALRVATVFLRSTHALARRAHSCPIAAPMLSPHKHAQRTRTPPGLGSVLKHVAANRVGDRLGRRSVMC